MLIVGPGASAPRYSEVRLQQSSFFIIYSSQHEMKSCLTGQISAAGKAAALVHFQRALITIMYMSTTDVSFKVWIRSREWSKLAVRRLSAQPALHSTDTATERRPSNSDDASQGMEWKCTGWCFARATVWTCTRVQAIRLICGLFSQRRSPGRVGDAGCLESGGLHSRKLSFKAPSSCISWKINTCPGSWGFGLWVGRGRAWVLCAQQATFGVFTQPPEKGGPTFNWNDAVYNVNESIKAGLGRW